MKVGLVIFARYDSSRLPGKALREIHGRPLLGRVIDRVRKISDNREIVVGTTARDVDDRIAAFATGEGLNVFRGATANTLQRAFDCAEAFKFDAIARICGDSPFLQPKLFSKLIQWVTDRDLDVATNAFPRTFPKGISAEVIRTKALARAVAVSSDPDEFEHCTLHFYRHPEIYRIANLAAPRDMHTGISLAVDTQEDLKRTDWILDHVEHNEEEPSLDRLLTIASSWLAKR